MFIPFDFRVVRLGGLVTLRPAAMKWVPGVCEKPRIKCTDCTFRCFLPVSDEAIRWHLSGQSERGQEFVMGVYPMLQDETCHFLAIDFDKEDWQVDTAAFVEVCHQLGLSPALERSRSGNGGHTWFFFQEAIPASLARKVGSYLLTETMERRPELGLDSYDRFFPNQDTLPKGGFGNLIALPLQKRPRHHGNTVFVDGEFKAYADQWAFLSSVPRMSRRQIEALVHEAEKAGRVVGVRLAITDENDVETLERTTVVPV